MSTGFVDIYMCITLFFSYPMTMDEENLRFDSIRFDFYYYYLLFLLYDSHYTY